ncbi:anthranilate synthase component I family protein [Parvularcula flava]|uniref:Aminodeoxychorismate synthase, component I n=1 Tax=Aquisalinus luteolus TaxID=1566827 RepID=A0A8J3ER26_9PROT|nr:anthranilate synthase component I family protein [Aquisalinus luteolus]NHK27974.1 anthranilate synthase component I family protein [Aquisalinus luteolus]GGH97092.1 aminodeoxychorismate synthase, component I [Aquisalinus luteolus]
MIERDFPISDPLAAFAPLAGQPFAHLLSGGAAAAHSWGGAQDMIVAAPSSTLVVRDGQVEVDGLAIGPASENDPFALLNERLTARKREGAGDGFMSGAVGYLSYEMARYIEPVLGDLPPAPGTLPEMAVGFYDAGVLFDRKAGTAKLVALSENAAARLLQAIETEQAREVGPVGADNTTPPDEGDFIAAVEACKARILDGSIFQANITRRLTAGFPGAALPGADWRALGLPLFERLHEASASPFGALLQFEEGCVLSDSPEKFLEVRPEASGLKAIAEPVKGTRRRREDPVEDRAVIKDLLSDEKDRAENVMITDLVRNDLSRVCRDHSIREEAVCELQSFAGVHHLVSRVSGVLREGVGAIDVLRASYPCGSITGAPKIRAMQVIADLEQNGSQKTGRGVYCGAIGWFDDRGGAMVSVPIRTAVLEPSAKGARLTYGAGGGITVLSDPQAEYQETVDKAGPFRRLIERRFAGEGP